MNKYQLWIEEHEWPIESDAIATLQMQLVFPELTIVKGVYAEPKGTYHERKWCIIDNTTTEGIKFTTIVDPLAMKYQRSGQYRQY